MAIPPCPHCGEQSGLICNCRAFGWAEEHVYPDGDTLLETSHVEYSKPKRVRCMACDKVRSDVQWEDAFQQ